jgi:predicted RNA methylase
MSENPSPEQPKSLNLIQQERRHLQEIIAHRLLPFVTPDLPRDTEGRVAILSVGSGVGSEALPFRTLIPESTYTGLEIDPVRTSAARIFQRDVGSDQQIQFETGDILTMDPERRFSVVFLRQPPVWHIRALAQEGQMIGWEKELDASLAHVAENGVWMATTESSHFYDNLIAYIKEKGLPILDHGEEKTSVTDLATADKYILIARNAAGSATVEAETPPSQ